MVNLCGDRFPVLCRGAVAEFFAGTFVGGVDVFANGFACRACRACRSFAVRFLKVKLNRGVPGLNGE